MTIASSPQPVPDRGRRRLLTQALALPVALGLPVLVHADLVTTVPRIKPSVVAVGTYQRTRSPAFQFRGTGFVVGDGQLVATNAHVLPERIDSDKMEALVIVVPG
ncbi:MAG TPA: serine protease, partial [Thauera sp.]|nr:serine protease [Thauera sp.]